MSDEFDLERLGDVWREQPGPAEMEELKRKAAEVRRNARQAQIVESGAALLVSAVVILLALLNPATKTFLAGAGAILILLSSQVRQRRLREAELQSLTGSTEDMLDQSIARAESAVKRARFGLVALVPSVLVGIAFASVVDSAGGRLLPQPGTETGLGIAVLIGGALLLAGMAVNLWRNRRNAVQELQRLSAMRDDYRQERESSSGGTE